MTKKDFELIASSLKATKNRQNITAMCNTLAKKYPRFNRDMFLKACGVEVECRKCEERHNDGIYHICPDNQ